jgi:hypothetical protein
MAHYDWRYESYTLDETENQIDRTRSLVETSKMKIDQINLDLLNIHQDYTKEVLEYKIAELGVFIAKYEKELTRWEDIKHRMTTLGEVFTWEQANSIAKGFRT